MKGANTSVLRLFKGSWKHIGHLGDKVLRQMIWFQKSVKKKDNASRSAHVCTEKQQLLGIGDTLERHRFSGLVYSTGDMLCTPWRTSNSMTTAHLMN